MSILYKLLSKWFDSLHLRAVNTLNQPDIQKIIYQSFTFGSNNNIMEK